MSRSDDDEAELFPARSDALSGIEPASASSNSNSLSPAIVPPAASSVPSKFPPVISTPAGGTYTVTTGANKTDASGSEQTISALQWDRLSDQRDIMIKAMIKVFTWLNGGVFSLVLVAFITGIFSDYRIVDSNTLMTLIGATVVQAGLAFAAITRFLFPGSATAGKPDQV